MGTKHFVHCFNNRVKVLCLNDVNNDKRIYFISKFVVEIREFDINN